MLRYLIAILTVVLTAGCAGTSPPTHFYVLESNTAPAKAAAMPELSLGLGPVVLPDTLDRPQIVLHDAAYRLELAEFHHWAGNLETNLGRLVTARLMAALGTDRVFPHPWPHQRQLDYQVRIDVLRFDGSLGGEAELAGTWTLLDGDGKRELYLKAFNLKEHSAGGDYRNLVATLSGLAARLADRIAAGIVGYLPR